MKKDYFPPRQSLEEFHCPHCHVYARQLWSNITASGAQYVNSWISRVGNFNLSLDKEWTISQCEHCKNIMIWKDELIVYPKTIMTSPPNDDLSDEIKRDYIEASKVLNDSPRASAALLRLSLQKLCKELGEKGENINEDIRNLVKKGLNPLVQKSLDGLRITGNNAVHPGEIDLDEQPERVIKMFELLNFIAEKMITEPRVIDQFYSELPESSIQAVNKRDSNS